MSRNFAIKLLSAILKGRARLLVCTVNFTIQPVRAGRDGKDWLVAGSSRAEKSPASWYQRVRSIRVKSCRRLTLLVSLAADICRDYAPREMLRYDTALSVNPASTITVFISRIQGSSHRNHAASSVRFVEFQKTLLPLTCDRLRRIISAVITRLQFIGLINVKDIREEERKKMNRQSLRRYGFSARRKLRHQLIRITFPCIEIIIISIQSRCN